MRRNSMIRIRISGNAHPTWSPEEESGLVDPPSWINRRHQFNSARSGAYQFKWIRRVYVDLQVLLWLRMSLVASLCDLRLSPESPHPAAQMATIDFARPPDGTSQGGWVWLRLELDIQLSGLWDSSCSIDIVTWTRVANSGNFSFAWRGNFD